MQPNWHPFAKESDFPETPNTPRLMRRINGKQILVLKTPNGYQACANQCPHEGYPLSEGCVDGEGVLTCQWHNWKFDLKTGENKYGGDELRIYPVKVENGEVWVNLADAPIEERVLRSKAHLQDAFSKNRYDQMSRELARLQALDVTDIQIAQWCIDWSWEHFEYGLTHAYAGLWDWITTAKNFSDAESKLICITEAIAHVADDILYRPKYPFETTALVFDEARFLEAIEQEDEAKAIALTRGAITENVNLDKLEALYSKAALSHYIGFGHGLIYVYKMFEMLRALTPDARTPILLNLTRYLIYAQREDLIPEFSQYATNLKNWGSGDNTLPQLNAWTDSSINKLMTQVLACSQQNPDDIHKQLLLVNAHHLLHFNTDCELASSVPVSKSASWLNVTHGLTFANAVGQQCRKFPELWPNGLLQMACFAGRNKAFVQPEPEHLNHLDHSTPVEAAIGTLMEKMLDHGLNAYIQSVHKLKVLMAGKAEIERLNPQEGKLILAAITRYINSPIKSKHTKRTAHQSLIRVNAE